MGRFVEHTPREEPQLLPIDSLELEAMSIRGGFDRVRARLVSVQGRFDLDRAGFESNGGRFVLVREEVRLHQASFVSLEGGKLANEPRFDLVGTELGAHQDRLVLHRVRIGRHKPNAHAIKPAIVEMLSSLEHDEVDLVLTDPSSDAIKPRLMLV